MPDNAAPVLILSRPAADSARFLSELGTIAAGLTVLVSPVLEIVSLTPPLPMPPPGGLILTSAHGAAAAARLGYAGLPVWVVGQRTAEVAGATGFAVQVAAPDAEALVGMILARRPGMGLLHLRGEHARGDIAGRLSVAGLRVGAVVAYAQRALPLGDTALAALGGNRPIVLPVFSPRSAALICGSGPFVAPVHLAAISGAAADMARDLDPASIDIAATPDARGMIAATAAAIRRASTG